MLKARTGFSFREAAGAIEDVQGRLLEIGMNHAPISDRASTFGFYKWKVLSEKNGLIPVYGVEIGVSHDPEAKKPIVDHWTFFAKERVGSINRLLTKATSQFRYQPLISYDQAIEAEGVVKITGHHPVFDWGSGPPCDDIFLPLGPSTPIAIFRKASLSGWNFAATSDNRYPRKEDKGFYEVLTGRNAQIQSYDQHIQSFEEWIASAEAIGADEAACRAACSASKQILEGCSGVELEQASLPHPERRATLREMCEEAAPGLGVDLSNRIYRERLDKELSLIADKGYEDYFYIVAGICSWARDRMIVGPARGSSCGSLACFLLRITTIDPIPHGLIFERFIDINRTDMPDIDIDFSDQQRDLVFDYIKKEYGAENVARLGTVAMFKPRSALQEAGAALRIPRWKCDAVVDTLIERSTGDSRALDTLADTLVETPAGKRLISDHPEVEVIPKFEGHPRHHSQHAAGVVIAERPITDFVAVDWRTGAAMCDKKDAEEGYNLLKIDALGLTQLSIFEDALELAGLPRDFLDNIPMEDEAAFDVLNQGRWAGIFQFNGLALQSLSKQTKVDCFEDIVAITALARPGPLTSGGSSEWVYRKNGWDPRINQPAVVKYPHPLFEPYLKDTKGIVIYQEQVMEIGRGIGDLSWEDVTALRKAMSKSLGKEYFDQFGDRWKKAASKKGIPIDVLDSVWDDLCAYGAWAFNKSHSVAYGMISYWCCYLKAHHAFEFAAATLSHQDQADKQIQLLREMVSEGYGYLPVSPDSHSTKWSVGYHDNRKTLIGPLINVHGIGPKMAIQIESARKRGEKVPERGEKLLSKPKTKIDSLFPISDRVKEILPDPLERNIVTPITMIGDISEEHKEETSFLVLGIAKTINPRDENEPIMIARRGYEIKNGPTESLNLQMEDDTGIIYCKINRWKFRKCGADIVNRGRPGKSIYAVKGSAMAGGRLIMVDSVKYIGDLDPSFKESQEQEQQE